MLLSPPEHSALEGEPWVHTNAILIFVICRPPDDFLLKTGVLESGGGGRGGATRNALLRPLCISQYLL